MKNISIGERLTVTPGESLFMPHRGASRAWLCRDIDKALVALPDENQAKELVADMSVLFPFKKVTLLPEIHLDKKIVENPSKQVQRGFILEEWLKDGGLLVGSASSLITPLLTSTNSLVISKGDDLGREFLIDWLIHNSYSRVDLVWRPGEFSVRGGIVDIYDSTLNAPVRVDFFDDEVDHIKHFATSSQRSSGRFLSWIVLRGISSGNREYPLKLIGDSSDLYIFDPKRCSSNVDAYRSIWNDLSTSVSIDEFSWDAFVSDSMFKRVLRIESLVEPRQVRSFIEPIPLFHGRLREIKNRIIEWIGSGYEVNLYSLSDKISSVLNLEPLKADISGGFIDTSEKVVYLSDREIYGRDTTDFEEVDQLPQDIELIFELGQLLVHEKYGVCRYMGVSSSSVNGQEQDFMTLEFYGEKRLLMPLSQSDRLFVYQGAEEEAPLDSLGSSRWKKALKKAQDQIEKEAKQIIELHATREVLMGRSFSQDNELSLEFDSSFPYRETDDQLRAIGEVKRDMESSRPMDRLVVGDVGYGKTEVALRAAFKAIYDGAQVALVVPTTVLAKQHFNTFISRMADFSINVELLSRFVTLKRQREILKGLSDGSVDLVVGTHRLLQEDVHFKDLGLVIIDEEHRFGVSHKEMLRKLKINVDVLTLSATPIPRTLSMAMKGLRDISEIKTAPQNRPPVITVTGKWSDSLVFESINRELSRGGQVYFLNDLVSSIEERAKWLQLKFPDYNVRFAHGQMRERELEEVMDDFYDGRIDILVCTTIIESGLDVGRANTIVIYDSRRLGLAQMHQLRGRVGRRNETGYALFLYPPDAEVKESTLDRLDSIGSIGGRGSGYDLAVRDLQLRGGGDLVGRSQHGHRERVGYLLYCEKLKTKIEELKGIADYNVKVKLNMPVAIPSSYVSQPHLRLALYRRFDFIKDENDLIKMRDELGDRFGPLPDAVSFLMDLSLLKSMGNKLGMTDIVVEWDKTIVLFSDKVKSMPRNWFSRDLKNWIGPGKYSGVSDLVNLFFEKG